MNQAAHDEYDALAVGWALHALEPGEENAFADHLATCLRCQRMVRESEEALGELAYEVPLVEPPPQLLDRLRHATGATDAMPGRSDQPVQLGERRSRRSLAVRWAAPAMAAAVALVALLGWNVSLRHNAQEQHQLAAQRQAVISQLAQSTTRAVLRDDTAREVGYVLQRGSRVEVVPAPLTGSSATGLPPNNTTKTTYVLWAVQRSGGPPVAVGTFDVLHGGLDLRPVKGTAPQHGFTAYAVSREPGRGLPQRPTEVVATGAVLS